MTDKNKDVMSETKNLTTWNKLRTPPSEALKEIRGGRLSGYTDISPMWRFQIMTETFGPCGIGWVYEVLRMWTDGQDKDSISSAPEICVFCDIRLKYKVGDDWSEWVPGTGGSKLAAQERNGMHISDECYKMSLTDALSVAMKAIGVGADVYMGKLSHNGSTNGSSPQTKYSAQQPGEEKKFLMCPVCKKESVMEGKKEFGGGYVCWKKSKVGGCGAKFKTLEDVNDPSGSRIAELVGRIHEAEAEFKKIGASEQYRGLLDEFKIDKAEDLEDEDVGDKLM
ncbi:hypothetical protein LCGC14_1463930, partial [marine sediment metagenome]